MGNGGGLRMGTDVDDVDHARLDISKGTFVNRVKGGSATAVQPGGKIGGVGERRGHTVEIMMCKCSAFETLELGEVGS